jgi:hypothetical protein
MFVITSLTCIAWFLATAFARGFGIGFGTGTSASVLPLAVELLGDLDLVPSPKGLARRCPSPSSSSGGLFAAP